VNLTYVIMCPISSHQTVNKQDTYTDFSVLHGNLLLIQDLIVVLLDEGSKVYSHIKHAPPLLKKKKLFLPRELSHKGIIMRTKKYNNEI